MPTFFPPELLVTSQPLDSEIQLEGNGGLIKTLYYRYLQGTSSDEPTERALVALVLDHAKRVIAHPSRPTLRLQESFERAPFGEVVFEESFEEDPFFESHSNVIVEVEKEKAFRCVCALDASSSMSGEKHLLASIAVAVLLLEVPARDTSLVVFSSEANAIKKMLKEETPEQTILKFLKMRPRGFTNIKRGLEEGLRQYQAFGGQKRKVALIATDGRWTEGGDPIEKAREFDFLVVLHLHGPGSHLDASREMAQAGNGVCLEVPSFDVLPRKMYEALRLISRL